MFQVLIQASQVATALLIKTVLMTDGSGCWFAVMAGSGATLIMDIKESDIENQLSSIFV